jgi:hypothetical protein
MSDQLPVKDRVKERIKTATEMLEPNEVVMLSILEANWGEGLRIGQREIAENDAWQLSHPAYAKDLHAKFYETMCRVVREEIRSLRVRYKIPVLSDGDGYFLPNSDEEVEAYVKRMESTVKSHAESSLTTYNAIKDSLGVESKFFDSLATEAKDVDDAIPPVSTVPTKPKETVKKIDPQNYIWMVLQDYLNAKFPKFAGKLKWERSPNSTLRWRVVFDETPNKEERREMRDALYAAGFGYPDLQQITGGLWTMNILCTANSAKASFKWRKKSTQTDEDQQLVYRQIENVARGAKIGIRDAKWRSSLTNIGTHWVLVFPKDASTKVTQDLKDALLAANMKCLVEAGSPNKLIFEISKNV